MIIKKFTAGTETEAILMAKEELGVDAVVMNVKKNTPKGIYRLFRKPAVEITAALDENIVYQNKREEGIRRNSAFFSEDSTPAATLDVSLEAADKRRAAFENSTAIEQKLNQLQSLLESQMAERTTAASQESEIETAAEKEPEKEDSNMVCMKLIYNQLVANEVNETYVNQIIGEIENKLKKDAGINNILMSIYQKIVLKLGQIKTIEVEEDQTKYIYFIGPTGVGKTTTIAKIASTLKMNQKKKVALMTADTYRIAAVEQLTTYANILDIPLRVVYSADEVKEAMEEMREYDVVLIDTAGRSHKNREQRDDVEGLINAIPPEEREVYLVVSATTKYQDLIKIAESYSEITDYALIFTKLDETSSIGNILNLHMKTGAALSYAAFGQNVPNDISVIDAQNIAKQLLGGNE